MIKKNHANDLLHGLNPNISRNNSAYLLTGKYWVWWSMVLISLKGSLIPYNSFHLDKVKDQTYSVKVLKISGLSFSFFSAFCNIIII